METLTDFALKEKYERLAKLGDKLAEIEALIDWESFRPIVKDMFDNQSEKGGRPNIDEVVMIKMLVLQARPSSLAMKQNTGTGLTSRPFRAWRRVGHGSLLSGRVTRPVPLRQHVPPQHRGPGDHHRPP